jgi:autotransporter-associated beta strand protein
MVHNINNPWVEMRLTKVGTGTQTFSGANSSFAQLYIDGGTIAIGAGGDSFSGVTLDNSGTTFDISAGGNQSISLTGVAGSTVNLGGNTLSLFTPSFAGVIKGSGGSLDLEGTSSLTGVNTYTGQTVISAGTLDIGAGGSIAASSVVNLAGSSTIFDISSGGNQTIQDLTGVAGSTVNLGANTLTTGTANSTIFAGVIQGGGRLTKQGAGALSLSGANTYSGGTSVTGGTLYANGGSADPSSATGTSAVSVGPGAALGGSGVIGPTVSGAGVTLAGTGTTTSKVATLISGGVQPAIGANGANTAVAGPGLTLDNRTAQGVILNAAVLSAGLPTANLTFYLGAGTTGLNGSTIGQAPFDFANPNTGSSYMNVPGSTPGELAFVSGDTITVIDLTGGNLQLNLDVPYLLIQADSNADYSGLVTTGGTDINGNALNGFVTNLTLTTGTGTAAGEYYDTRLYLYNGDLEIVPEPGTWVMLLGGLIVLMFCQRRQYRKQG